MLGFHQFLAFAALGAGLLATWQGARKVVDRWSYGGRYEDVVALEYFLQESKSVTHLPQLVQTLVQVIARALRARETHFLLLSDDGLALVASSTNLEHLPRLGQDSPLVQWLETRGEVLTRRGVATSHDLRGLTMSDFRFLEESHGELYVPLKSEGKLVGILVLGPSLSPLGYSQHDLSLVSLAASRIATTIHDAHLFAEQKTMAQEMARLSQLKSDFVGIVAHEFKTPLTAIKASAGMLADESVQQSETLKRRLLASLNRGVNRLDKLVKDSLKLASIQAAATELELEGVDVRQLVDEVVLTLFPLARAKSQVVRVPQASRLPRATLDPSRFQEVLSNLVDNAIKYSPEGSRITIALRDRRHALMVEVCDEAPQIPEKEREAIFNPYYRLKTNGARAEGSGLGLAIAKGQAERLGGRIWVDSAGAKGNRFCFSVPYRPPQAPPVLRTELVKGGNRESVGD